MKAAVVADVTKAPALDDISEPLLNASQHLQGR